MDNELQEMLNGNRDYLKEQAELLADAEDVDDALHTAEELKRHTTALVNVLNEKSMEEQEQE